MADGQQFMSTAQIHAQVILDKWERLSDLSVALLENHLNSTEDKNALNSYIALLFDLWAQLYPKVKDRDTFGDDIKAAFEDFKAYRKKPRAIALNDKSIEDLLAMQEHIAIVLEKLHITDFEVGMK